MIVLFSNGSPSPRPCEQTMLPALTVNKGYCSHQATKPPPAVPLEGPQDGKEQNTDSRQPRFILKE